MMVDNELLLAIEGLICASEDRLEERIINRMESRMAQMLKPLTNDITELKQGITAITHDMNELKQDINVLRQDVNVLRQDVNVLKQDVNVLKQDVNELKQDMNVLKQDMNVLKQRVSALETKYTSLSLIIENDISRKIDIIGEGHDFLKMRLDEALLMEKRRERMELEIVSLRMELQKIKDHLKIA